jgi:hypothetical protein
MILHTREGTARRLVLPGTGIGNDSRQHSELGDPE